MSNFVHFPYSILPTGYVHVTFSETKRYNKYDLNRFCIIFGGFLVSLNKPRVASLNNASLVGHLFYKFQD